MDERTMDDGRNGPRPSSPRPSSIVHRPLAHLRWVLPLLFVGGYLATYSRLWGFEIEYLVWTFLCTVACCLLLARLCPYEIGKLPIWIILAVFIIAFYFKFYWIARNPESSGDDWVSLKLYYLAQSPTVLMKCFKTISYAFISYCLVSVFLLGNTKAPCSNRSVRNVDFKTPISILIWLIPALMLVTTYVMYIYGIARMAAENQYLPLRLAGWIFNIRVTLIPALLLLLIWCSDQIGFRQYLTLGMILLFLHGASDMLLRSSRGFLLELFIMLTVLFVITKRMTKTRLRLLALVLLITIVLIPLVSHYRAIRSKDVAMPIGYSLAEATRNMSDVGSSLWERLGTGSIFMLSRFTGTESLLHIVGSDLPPLYTGAFTGSINVTKHMTVNVIGFPDEAMMGYAPSALGWLYLVGGNVMVVAGICILVTFAWFCWRLLAKLSLFCTPVAQAIFISWYFLLFTEGTLDRPYVRILIMAGTIVTCEWILRISTGGAAVAGGSSVRKKIRFGFLYRSVQRSR